MGQASQCLPSARADRSEPTSNDISKGLYGLVQTKKPFDKIRVEIVQEQVSEFICHLSDSYYAILWRHHERHFIVIDVVCVVNDGIGWKGRHTLMSLGNIGLGGKQDLARALETYKRLMVDPDIPAIARTHWPVIKRLYGIIASCRHVNIRYYRLRRLRP